MLLIESFQNGILMNMFYNESCIIMHEASSEEKLTDFQKQKLGAMSFC